MNYGRRFVTLYRRQGSRPSPRKIMQKSKMAVWGDITNSCEKKRSKGGKERYKHLNAEFQRIASEEGTRAKADRIKLEWQTAKCVQKISCGFPSIQLKAGLSLRSELKALNTVRRVRVGHIFFWDQPHHWLRIS